MRSKSEIQYTIRELERIKITKGECVLDKNNGLCKATTFKLEGEFIRSWEHFSGNIWYPVMDTDSSKSAIVQYIETSLWKGRQLELRLSFTEHLLKCYTKYYEDNFT